mgnify:CR=1 FL=1
MKMYAAEVPLITSTSRRVNCLLGAPSRSRAEARKGWGGQETAAFLTASFVTLAAVALEARLVRSWAGAVWAGARPGRAKLGISWAAGGATGNFFTARGLWPIPKPNKPDAHTYKTTTPS